MRIPTSGTHCPSGTTTWLIANQAIPAGDNFQPAGAAAPGATPTGGPIICSARASTLPRSATGAEPVFNAYCAVAGTIEITISNPGAGALVAMPANITLEVIQFPLAP